MEKTYLQSHRNLPTSMLCYSIQESQNVKKDFEFPTQPLHAFIFTIQSNTEKLQEHIFEISIPAGTLVSVRKKDRNQTQKGGIPVHNIKLCLQLSQVLLSIGVQIHLTMPNNTEEVVLCLFCLFV